MNISDLKENQSIKITYQYSKDSNEKEYRGILVSINEYDVNIVSPDNKTYDGRYADFLYQIDKSCIKSISRTRFPKELSDKLKEMAKEIRQLEKLESELLDLKENIRTQCEVIRKIEQELIVTKFKNSPSLNDIAFKMNEDIKDLDKHSYDRNDDKSFSIYNCNVNDNGLFFQMTLSKSTRNISGVELHYNHLNNLEMNDWDRVAKNYTPNFDSLVEKSFSFAKKIKASRSAEPGDKGYIYLTNDFIIYLDVNKDNYAKMVSDIKEAAKKVSTAYIGK